MALVHEKLFQSEDLARVNFAHYIRSLTSYLFGEYGKPGIVSLKRDIEDVFLDINIAFPCGLIISELVSNSLKHAFPGSRGGEITIALHPLTDNELELIVRDNGVGFPKDLDFRKTESLGMQLVTSLVGQLNGTIALDRRSGTTFTITFRYS